MDERNYELIDKYLRKEMSPEESLNFEQEALNNPELRKEIELTYRIKRSLADRQHKLHKTAQWESNRKYKNVSFATIMSIAAMFVVGFFIMRPSVENVEGNLVASTSVKPTSVKSTPIETTEELKALNKSAIAHAKQSISNGEEEMVIAEVTRLEEQNVIPTLNDVSKGSFVMSNSIAPEDAEILSRDAYELHWLKIKSLISVGKNKDAAELLKSFVLIEGKYKESADSLLQTIE